MEKEQLRKADLLTGLIFFVFGLWVVYEGLKMPMAESYGGVQNVWYVSPALFPLCVGGAITLLGLGLFKVALSSVGTANATKAIKSLFVGEEGEEGITSEGNFRFLTIVILFVCYVFLFIPRVDFLICSLLFLFTFINIFHLDDPVIFRKMLKVFSLGVIVTIIFFAAGLDETLGSGEGSHPGDWLTTAFLAVMIAFTYAQVKGSDELKRRFKHGTIVAFVAPFILCPVFKFFLLVPLPYEGNVVEFLDMLWYWEF
ncbi:tripartite tricarboxylate transporter TctB family protein [Pseudodesulfovibrio sp.]|nr:tripartite tricarboxylate transporter TctB family protein [Pseudodesulfovibrio sp.]